MIVYYSCIFILCSRLRHAESGEIREPRTDAGALVVVWAAHQRDEPGQTVGGGLHQDRPVVVRLGDVRKLLPRVFRGHRTQVRRPRGAAAAVLRQLEGVAVAEQPVQPRLYTGPGQHVRVEHDVRAAHHQRGVRVLLHDRLPAGVHAPAAGRCRKTLRLPGTRKPARSHRHAPERIADAGQQSPGRRFGRADGAQLRTRGRHALRARRSVA